MSRLARAVTIAYLGGPLDGHTETRRGMPPRVLAERYCIHHAVTDGGGGETWHYRWRAERTGHRAACQAGSDRGCLGSRCPSKRQRHTT